MNAQTIRRVDLKAQFLSVSSADFDRFSRRHNARFVLLSDGKTQHVNADTLRKLYPDHWQIIFQTKHNFCLINNTWIQILEGDND